MIDSVPVTPAVIWYQILDENTSDLDDSDIYNVSILYDKDQIDEFPYNTKGIDSIFFITTKLYHNRPNEMKAIPTPSELREKKGIIHFHDEQLPYSGPFITYYYSGKRFASGHIVNGKIEDTVTKFFKDGTTVRQIIIYKEGVRNGVETSYFPNHKIEATGRNVNGEKEGIWKQWYSTGEFKLMMVYHNREVSYLDEGTKSFFKCFDYASVDLKYKDYNKAIEGFNKAIGIKSNIADVYYKKSIAESRLRLYDSAIADLDKVLALEPAYSSALSDRIIVRLKKYGVLTEPADKHPNVTDTSRKTVEFPPEERLKMCTDVNTLLVYQRISGFDLVPVVYWVSKQEFLDEISKYCVRGQ